MSKVTQDALTFLNQFRSLTAFAESVAELGNVESGLNDLRKERDNTIKERDAAKKELADLNGQVKTQKVRHAQMESEINDIKSVALDAARHIREDAKREAEKMIEAANENIKHLNAAFKEKNDKANLDYANTIREKDAAEAELKRMNDGIDAIRVKLGS